MEPQEIKINICGNEYKINLFDNEDMIGTEFSRNGKILVSSVFPVNQKADVKMAMYQKLQEYAAYDIEHELVKLKL